MQSRLPELLKTVTKEQGNRNKAVVQWTRIYS